jgi:transcriptional regulator with XRE-family HTH domain
VSRGNVESLRSPEYALLIAIVKEARERSGLTQKEICDRLGKPKNYLIKVEAGERRLDIVELCQLARELGVDPKAMLIDFVEAAFPTQSN